MAPSAHLHAAPATLPALAIIVAVGAVALLAVGAGPALANHIACGETITTDTTLDSTSSTARTTAS